MKKSILLSLFVAIGLSAKALDVTLTTPGSLASAVGDNTTATTLKINGPVNAADFHFISTAMTSLTQVDLADAAIEPYQGTAVLAGRSSFPANELPAYSFFGSKVQNVVLPPTLTAIETAAFASSDIKSIVIPASVTKIEASAFASCKALKQITLPSTVASIGYGLFNGCTGLETATILAPLDSLPAKTFAGTASLAEISVPATLKTIGREAFSGCGSLRAYPFGRSLATVSDKAFAASGLVAANLSATAVDSIGAYAFMNCTSLATATLPDREVALGEGVFFGDTSLSNVVLPQNCSRIPAFTFKDASAMPGDGILPQSIAEIGDYALMGWSGVKEFTLPRSLESLGEGAMENWSAIEKLNADSLTTVPALGAEVWEGIDPSEVILYVSEPMYQQFKSASQWGDFTVTVRTAGIGGIENDNSDADRGIRFELLDEALVITSLSQPIADVAIHDLAGRLIARKQGDSDRVAIPTRYLPDGVFLATAVLTDGAKATAKIRK